MLKYLRSLGLSLSTNTFIAVQEGISELSLLRYLGVEFDFGVLRNISSLNVSGVHTGNLIALEFLELKSDGASGLLQQRLPQLKFLIRSNRQLQRASGMDPDMRREFLYQLDFGMPKWQSRELRMLAALDH